jgi:excisionase family DNA binding protein
MTKKEVAGMLAVSVRTIERLVASRQIPQPVYLGGSAQMPRWRATEIEKYLRRL